MKEKTVRIIADFVLVFVVICVAAVGLGGNTVKAFKSDDNSAFYRGNVNAKNVSLMFNVYWGTEYVDGILCVLDEYGAKATFFVGGYWVAQNGDTLASICAHGHEIGNHGYYHKEHEKLSLAENKSEIEKCSKAVFDAVGVRPTLFAPPSGSYSSKTLDAANSLGYKTVMWSKDTIDWRDKDSSLVFSRATSNVKNGELILMHPTEHTLKALPKTIEFLQKMGYNIVTVSQNLNGG